MYLFALENYPSIFDFMLANHDMMESEMTYFFNWTFFVLRPIFKELLSKTTGSVES